MSEERNRVDDAQKGERNEYRRILGLKENRVPVPEVFAQEEQRENRKDHDQPSWRKQRKEQEGRQEQHCEEDSVVQRSPVPRLLGCVGCDREGLPCRGEVESSQVQKLVDEERDGGSQQQHGESAVRSLPRSMEQCGFDDSLCHDSDGKEPHE